MHSADTSSLMLNSALNQYAIITNNLGLTDGPITMEGWFKLGTNQSSGPLLLNHDDVSTFVSERIYYGGGSVVQFDRSRNGAGAENVACSTCNLGDNNWHHVAFTYDGTLVSGYFDGTLVVGPFVSVGDGVGQTPMSSFSVGQFVDNIPPLAPFNGLADEVRVWNYARTQTEISTYLHQELTGNESGLVAYYRFENNHLDGTTNGYTLTGINSPTFSSDTALVSLPPAAMTTNLIVQVGTLNLQVGIENSLDSKLSAALSALGDQNQANNVAAINDLNAFINACQAQRGKRISTQDANALIAAAQSIINTLSGN